MGRPAGWDVVGLPRDPTPGDIHGIAALRSSYAALANEAASAATTLRAVQGSATQSGVWQGAAASAFAEQIGDFPEMLDKCEKSYRDVVAALGSWLNTVDLTQDQADRQLTKAKAAQQDIDAGSSKVSSAQLTFNSADASLTAALKKVADWQGQTPPANIKLPTPADITLLRSSRTSAHSALTSAQGDVADAKSRLETARKLIGEAKAEYESAAESTATVIREARKKAVPRDSIWKKIADSKAWQILVTVVTVIIAVAVIVALVVGTGGAVLALIITAAGLILSLDDIVQFMSGNMSGAEFALAVALSLVPGGKAGKAIVSGLKRAVGPLAKVAGVLGDLRKATGPAMAKLAAGFKEAGAKIADHFVQVRKEWVANPDAGYIRPSARPGDVADAGRKGGDDLADSTRRGADDLPVDPLDPKQATKAHPSWSSSQKGEFGEAVSDRHMKDQGYTRVDAGDKAVNKAGIDAIYERKVVGPDGVEKTEFVIVEAKYRKADGVPRMGKVNDELGGPKVTQMSDKWLEQYLNKRIIESAGERFDDVYDALKRGEVTKLVTHVNSQGKVTEYLVDSAGKLTKAP